MKDLIFYEHEVRRKDTFTVYFQNFKQKNRFRPHWHDYYELLFFYEGNATVYCNDTKIPVTDGDLIVVNRTEVHTMFSESGASYYCVIIYPEFFSDIDFDNIQIPNHIHNDKTAKMLMHNLYDERHNAHPGSDMMLKSHAYALMTHLLRNYTVTHMSQKDSNLLAVKAQRIDTVLDYIDKHHAEKLSTSELAVLCHLNESYFCRYFKKATGKSVLGYINDYRIEKATELLNSGDESIAAVAAEVGFDDIAYFGRCFKKAKGVSPSQYRLQTFK